MYEKFRMSNLSYMRSNREMKVTWCGCLRENRRMEKWSHHICDELKRKWESRVF